MTGEWEMAVDSGWSKTWTYFQGGWHEGNVPIMGPRTHAAWLCSVVFDGARAFEGVTPDLDLHCARVNDSAKKLYLKPTVPAEEWIRLAREGITRFDKDAALYIRPMYWAEKEGPWVQAHDPESTQWCISIYEAPMRAPKGFSLTLSPYRRPTIETMPVDAKAGCLYPNNSRALFEAQSRGFDNAIVCDMLGNVAELATSNVFMAKDGVVFTPIANGTFLAGITRQRVIGLLRGAGVKVVETTLAYRDFEGADEIFATGNYSKVVPVTRIGARSLQFGPHYTKARELYWAFAHS
jgi:branched-chain amino acid aminotransferase